MFHGMNVYVCKYMQLIGKFDELACEQSCLCWKTCHVQLHSSTHFIACDKALTVVFVFIARNDVLIILLLYFSKLYTDILVLTTVQCVGLKVSPAGAD